MSVASWLEKIRKAEKTCMINDGKRKVHYKFTDTNEEMAEEYDLMTSTLLARKWRHRTAFGGPGQWQLEIGEPLYNPNQFQMEGIKENQQNPTFYRVDEENTFQWKVRNIPYPLDNYRLAVDSELRQICIETLNKKYYKRFSVPDLDRCNLPYENDRLSVNHQHNTLLIKYEKPIEILQMEALVRQEVQKLKAQKEGDVECNPS